MAEGRSALADLGISRFPVGTKQEVEDAGLDLLKVACCAPEVPGQVRGCAVHGLCRFDHQSMGGFKGEGPRYVGVRTMDPATGELGTNQDVHVCHAFVHGLQKRADYGAAARRESNGRRGEVIRVIAQEGEKIKTRYDVPINGKGEVINVMPEMIEDLKANGIKYSLLPGEIAVGRNSKLVLERTVPHFKRMNEVGGESFAQQVAMMDMAVDAEARERIDYAASPVHKPMVAEPVEPPIAEPVRRGPGRLPNEAKP